MHETADDLIDLQNLLDESDALAGQHCVRSSRERRLSARETCERLPGMRLSALATLSRDGRPFVGPVDGVLFRGSFHFSSSNDSLRVRHIRERPFVSATHLPGEDFAVTVHASALVLDATDQQPSLPRETPREIYVPA